VHAALKAWFELLTGTGHMPQMETPGQVLQAVS
jgi:pimeloyl-ACP methyl ester carboxylesterase